MNLTQITFISKLPLHVRIQFSYNLSLSFILLLQSVSIGCVLFHSKVKYILSEQAKIAFSALVLSRNAYRNVY